MQKYVIIVVFSLFLPLISFLNQGMAISSEEPTILNNIHYSQESDYSRITIDMNNPAEYHEKYLSNPERIYLDLDNASISEDIKTLQVDNGVLKQVRAAQHDQDTVRVVVELLHFADYKVYTLTSPDRLVIDIYKENAVRGNTAKETPAVRNYSNNVSSRLI
ncbi:MAG: AMIN domain-containing protein, partial [Nitrospira sp.]|nr:AMIN domain-containing protein [Nitrospira sp.]